MAARMNHRRPVTQVHFGGGTPTFLTPEELARLGMMIHENFHLDLDCEFGVEIDPRRLTSDHIEALQVIGANRASIGVQDTNPEVQLAIHRWQPHELNVRAVAWLRDAGFESINVDLIYGLPRADARMFARTIDDVLALSPDRLSVFSYAHVPWLRPAQRIFETARSFRGPPRSWPCSQPPTRSSRRRAMSTSGWIISRGPTTNWRSRSAAAPFTAISRATAPRGARRSTASESPRSIDQRNVPPEPEGHREVARGGRPGALPVERGLVLTEEDRAGGRSSCASCATGGIDFAALSESLGTDIAGTYAAEIEGMSDLEEDGLVIRTRAGSR